MLLLKISVLTLRVKFLKLEELFSKSSENFRYFKFAL